jgi:hypothetical protein
MKVVGDKQDHGCRSPSAAKDALIEGTASLEPET